MKPLQFLAIPALFSLALLGQSSPTLSGTCQSGGSPSYPQCVSGEVTFVGANYSGTTVHVRVKNSSGLTIDSSYYQVTGGNVAFTENLSFADTYTVRVGGDDDGGGQTYTVSTY